MTLQPEVWLMRHTEAAAAAEPDGDADRPLTPLGRADAASMGAALGSRALLPKRVFCSPLRRARETAEGLLEALAATFKAQGEPVPTVQQDTRLAPGQNAEDLVAEVIAEGPLPALLVGHNPDMEELALLLAGESVRFTKGTFARLAARGGAGSLLETLPGPRR